MSKKTYTIKPLEWKRIKNAGGGWFSAPAIGGVYEVRRPGRSRKWWWTFDGGKESVSNLYGCRTAEEGMAEAEEHWRKTIERFLEEVNHE